jgi:hypothetical protein
VQIDSPGVNVTRLQKICRALASLHVTIIALIMLAVLVVWGTIYQASFGLYAAMRHIFGSWVALAGGIVPLPGLKLVMTVLFVNLVFALIFRIRLGWRQAGLILVHVGLLLLIVGAFLTSLLARETYLTLLEGEENNMSAAYGEWELYLARDNAGGAPLQFAIAEDNLVPGNIIPIPELRLFIKVREFHGNCLAGHVPEGAGSQAPLNSMGFNRLTELAASAEPGENAAGGVFNLRIDLLQADVLLHGRDAGPTACTLGDARFRVFLRHRTHPLPCTIRLLSFKMIHYPGSDIVRSYESKVQIKSGGLERDAMISMNRPLRYKDFTFYQSSYNPAEGGRYYSTFSVVENSGRLVPYISSIITFIGLAWHFVLLAWRRLKQPAAPERT